MTDSGIWLKRVHPQLEMSSPSFVWTTWLRRGLPVLLITLAGCGNQPDPKVLVPQPAEDEVSVEAAPAAFSASPEGLTALPSREQVLASVPEGRSDPFAPVVLNRPPDNNGDVEAASALGLTVQGVLKVGGELRALVSTTAGAGTVCVGPRGRCPEDAGALLPPDWSVQVIDLRQGCLNVTVSGQAERFCMA